MSILSTNQRLISLGQDYSAGENIGISDYVISSRNWTPDITYAAESAFQRANEYTNTQISALSGDVSSEVSQLGSDIQYISGVALTAHQSLEGYLTKASGDEYYQPIGSYATVSQLESTSGEIVSLIPTDYVSNETLEQTSGNIVNLIPDVSEFITNVSAEQTYQPIGNYLSSNALEGYATQDWVGEQGYITGVDLSNYYTKNETSGAEELAEAFNNIGPGGDEEVNELVHSNSGEWNDVSSKLDESVFQETSGLFLTAIPQEYITESDIPNFISGKLDTDVFAGVSGDFLVASSLNGYATESFVENVSGDITALIPTNYYPDNNPSGFITGVDLTPYQTIEGMTAYQPVGDYATTTQINDLSGAIDYVSANAGDQEVHNIVHTNSATWNSVTNKLDTTAFSDVSGSFLTAHQDLSDYAKSSALNDYQTIEGMVDYQTVAGMTAYQPIGDYATTADLALKQDTLTFGYDEQDRINSINSSALAGGGDVPEDVMVETNLEYNAVNEISGYNGSAIAQYGAEKQWLVHDDTLVHAANSAQYALGVNLSAVAQLLGVDETVLYSGNTLVNTSNTVALSEPLTAFKKFKILDHPFTTDIAYVKETTFENVNPTASYLFGTIHAWIDSWQASSSGSKYDGECYYSANGNYDTLLTMGSFINSMAASGAHSLRNQGRIYKVIGIGRKQ